MRLPVADSFMTLSTLSDFQIALDLGTDIDRFCYTVGRIFGFLNEAVLSDIRRVSCLCHVHPNGHRLECAYLWPSYYSVASVFFFGFLVPSIRAYHDFASLYAWYALSNFSASA